VPWFDPNTDANPAHKDSLYLFWNFASVAVYKDSGVDLATSLPCACRCCRFEQIVTLWTTIRSTGPFRSRLDKLDRPTGEDCKGEQCYGKGTLPSCVDGAGKFMHDSITGRGSCDQRLGGDEFFKTEFATLVPVDDAESLQQMDLKSLCVHFMRDYPGIPVTCGQEFDWRICFEGRIRDRCREDKIVPPSPKSFMLIASGVRTCDEKDADGIRWTTPPQILDMCDQELIEQTNAEVKELRKQWGDEERAKPPKERRK